MSDIITIVQICSEVDFSKDNTDIYFKEITTNTPIDSISNIELEAWVKDDFYYDTTLFARAKHVSTEAADGGWSYIRSFQVRGNKWYLEQAGLIRRWDTSKVSTISLKDDRNSIDFIKCAITGEKFTSIPNTNQDYPIYDYPGINFEKSNTYTFTTNKVEARSIAIVLRSIKENDSYIASLIGGTTKDNNNLGLQLDKSGIKIDRTINYKSFSDVNNTASFFINSKWDSNSNNLIFDNGKLTIIVVNLNHALEGFTFDKLGSFIFRDNNWLFPYNGTIYDICLFSKPLSGILIDKVVGTLFHQWNKIFPEENIVSYFSSEFPYKSKLPDSSVAWNPGDLPGVMFVFDADKVKTIPPNTYYEYQSVIDPIRPDKIINAGTNNNTNNPSIVSTEIGKALTLANNRYLQWNTDDYLGYNGPKTIVLVEKESDLKNGDGLIGFPNTDNSNNPANVLFTNKNGSMYPHAELPFKSSEWRIHLIHQKGSIDNPGTREHSFIRLNAGNKVLLPDLPVVSTTGLGNKILLGKNGDPSVNTGAYIATSSKISFVMIFLGELSDDDHDRLLGWVARSRNLVGLLPNDFKYKNELITYPPITKTPTINTLNERVLLNETEFVFDINVNEDNLITGNIFKEENRSKLEVLSIFNDPLLLDREVNLNNGGIIRISRDGSYILASDSRIRKMSPGEDTVYSHGFILIRDIASLLEQVYVITFKFTRTDIGQDIINRITSNLTKSVSNVSTSDIIPFDGLEDYTSWLKIKSMNDLPYPGFNHPEGKLFDEHQGFYKYKADSNKGPILVFDPTKASDYSGLSIVDPPIISKVKMVIIGGSITKTLYINLSVSNDDLTEEQKLFIRSNCSYRVSSRNFEYSNNILNRSNMYIGKVAKIDNEVVPNEGITKNFDNMVEFTINRDSYFTLRALPNLASLEPSLNYQVERFPIEFVFPDDINPRVTFIPDLEIKYRRDDLTQEERDAFEELGPIDFTIPDNTTINLFEGFAYPWAKIRRVNSVRIDQNNTTTIYKDPNNGEFSINLDGLIEVINYPGLILDKKVNTSIYFAFGSNTYDNIYTKEIDVSITKIAPSTTELEAIANTISNLTVTVPNTLTINLPLNNGLKILSSNDNVVNADSPLELDTDKGKWTLYRDGRIIFDPNNKFNTLTSQETAISDLAIVIGSGIDGGYSTIVNIRVNVRGNINNETNVSIDINVNTNIEYFNNIFDKSIRDKYEVISIFNDTSNVDKIVSCNNGGKIRVLPDGNYYFFFDQAVFDIAPGNTLITRASIGTRNKENGEVKAYSITFVLSRTDITDYQIDAIKANLTTTCSNTETAVLDIFKGLEVYSNWMKIIEVNGRSYPNTNVVNTSDSHGGRYDLSTLNKFTFYPEGEVFSQLPVGQSKVSSIPIKIQGGNITKVLNTKITVKNN